MQRRHGRIGGSDLAALVGLSSFGKGPADVYSSIVDNARFESNRYMRRGTAAEPTVREMYLAETGAILCEHPGVVEWDECFAASVDDLAARNPSEPGCPEHQEAPCGICYADIVGFGYAVSAEDRKAAEERVRQRSFPVDYKTASINSIRKWCKVDKKTGTETWEMPSAYRVQLALYMAVFDLPRAELFVAFGRDRPGDEPETPGTVRVIPLNQDDGFFDVVRTKLLTLERDYEFEAMILEAGRAFWREHIAPRIPPLDYVSRSVGLSVTGSGDGSPPHRSGDAPYGKLEESQMNLTKEELDFLNGVQGVTVEAGITPTPCREYAVGTSSDGIVTSWVEILPPDVAPQVHPDWKEVQ